MKIYTRYGDNGDTQLLGGQQTRKNDVRIAVCGTLDELNAVLGMVASRNVPDVLVSQLTQIQSDLFTIGANIAAIEPATKKSDTKMNLPKISADDTQRLESGIDAMEAELKPLTNFLLPGGARAAADMHLARAVCRRVERLIVDLLEVYPDSEPAHVLGFLNRLSDWCFVAARYINHVEGIDEPIWRGKG